MYIGVKCVDRSNLNTHAYVALACSQILIYARTHIHTLKTINILCSVGMIPNLYGKIDPAGTDIFALRAKSLSTNR